MQNIAFFLPYVYPCSTGGVEVFSHNLILNEVFENAYKFTTCRRLKIKNRITIYDKLFIIRRFGLGNISICITFILKLFLLRNKIKIIYAGYTSNSYHLGYILPIAKKIFRIPYVLHIHAGGMLPWKPYFLHYLLFNEANKIAAVSLPLKIEYEKRSKKSIDILLPLIRYDNNKLDKLFLKHKYGLAKFNNIILFVGSLKKIKAPDIALRAFKKLDEKYIMQHNVCIIFIGSGELLPTITYQAKQSNMRERIKILGMQPRNIVEEIYSISDIYCISSWYEGTPLSLLEAMHYGLACIGTNAEGINEIIKNGINGLLFERDNINELSDKFKFLIENKVECERLKMAGKKFFCDHYNYDTHLNKYRNFLSI